MTVFSSLVPLLLLFLSASSPYVNGKLENKCSTEAQNMTPCSSFVTIGSQVHKPDASCCSGLKTVLDTKPECLCVALKQTASKGIKVNITKAVTLFSVCKLDAPPTTTPAHSSPSPHSSHGASLISISGLSFAISVALLILFSRI